MEYKILHIFNKAQYSSKEGVPLTIQRVMSDAKIFHIKCMWEDSIREVEKKKGFTAYLTECRNKSLKIFGRYGSVYC